MVPQEFRGWEAALTLTPTPPVEEPFPRNGPGRFSAGPRQPFCPRIPTPLPGLGAAERTLDWEQLSVQEDSPPRCARLGLKTALSQLSLFVGEGGNG